MPDLSITKPKILSKSFRLTIGKTKFRLIIGFYTKNNSISFRRFGLLPCIYTTGFEKDHIRTNGFSLWIKSFFILFDKYQYASKFGLMK